ncbi:hypothetical protein ACHAXR_000713, partial [Thalassiosira sp. AJA248-18]
MATEPLTSNQINTYLRDGVLVVDNLLSPEELLEAHEGLAQTLMETYGVNVHDLEGTGHKLVEASSTNGAGRAQLAINVIVPHNISQSKFYVANSMLPASYFNTSGGVLDIFYPDWKMNIATNETLFRMTCQLWKETYCHAGEKLEELTSASSSDDTSFKWHPFGAFDCDKGYIYIDRIGYRIPTTLAVQIGKQLMRKKSTSHSAQQQSSANSTKLLPTKKKKSKARPIQRSLTPHFDCCPENYDEIANKNKWRPIQCFVSLTDNAHPNTGGFEAAPGFH